MKVILLKDVTKIGKKFEVKDVKNGYASNFLIPKGLAKPATEEAIKWLETQKEIQSIRAEEDLKKVQEIASSLDDYELSILVKVGEQDQLFESINTSKVAEKLKEAGFGVKKNQIILEEPIKELGEYPIRIKFDHNLEAVIKLIVNGESQEKEEE